MLVLAGPGSGKTMVLTRRVQYLTEICHIPPGEILVITFTKAAAREMKERYLRLTNSGGTAVSFGTFHAVFFQILKLAYGYRADNILRETEKYQFLREAIYRQKLEPDDEAELIGSIAAEISKVKNDRINRRNIRPLPAIPKALLPFSTNMITACAAAIKSISTICWSTATSF